MSESPDLAEIYREYSQRLYSFLMAFLKDEHDVKDVMQQVFLKLARKSNLLGEVNDRGAFLLRLARNEAIDLCRRRGSRQSRQKDWQERQPDYAEESIASDQKNIGMELAAALDGIPEEQRVVVELKLWQEMTFAQIAQVLDISANTAASRYRYAIDKLQTRLRPVYEDIIQRSPS